MAWTCTQVEERLSDFLDGALPPAEARELEAHAASCAHCGPLVARVRGMLARVHELEAVEAPPYLEARIIKATLGPRGMKAAGGGWRNWLKPLLQPQFALGAAAALCSLAVVLQFVVPVRWKKTAFEPGEVFFNANRQAHLVYSRGVKYVNDLRVVYEIQSRLRPEPPPEAEPEPPVESPHSSAPQQKSQDGKPGHSANPERYCFAVAFMPMMGGN